MATWHQIKAGNGYPKGNPEYWTVHSNPPNHMSGSMTGFTSRKDAEKYLHNLCRHHPTYEGFVSIIPPTTKK